MLDLAKEKNCYKNLINAIISSNTKLPIEDKTYDIVIMAGVLCPGHIKIDAFDEILRITKSGMQLVILFFFLVEANSKVVIYSFQFSISLVF
jgi:ubiquinone/menaquinone biosynthesis C-methylase UbiE